MGSKEVKIVKDNESRQDRISVLPDLLIHHILSFLPSTKHAIRTSVLSKRWHKQWTHVPVLVFDFYIRALYISRCIDNILTHYNCSKLMKFHMKLPSWCNTTNQEILRFAITKEVEELILNFRYIKMFELPNFIFNSASLVKLHVDGCIFNPIGGVNWPNLKHLYVQSGSFPNQSVVRVVSGSPLLESLELKSCGGINMLVIASEYLKRLVLQDVREGKIVLKISCPNLVEFCAIKSRGNSVPRFNLCGEIAKDPSSSTPNLDIYSDSLKRIVLQGFSSLHILVSCPNLEELNLYSLDILSFNLGSRIQSSISVDFDFSEAMPAQNLRRQFLWHLDGIKDLKMGPCFIKSLSAIEMERLSAYPWHADDTFSYPPLNHKCLTFDCGLNFVECLPGIAYALRTSPELEKVVITLRLPEYSKTQDRQNLFWNPKGAVFDCLVSHLKIVKVVGLSEKDDKRSLVLNVIEFLLKNGRVLEKLVVVFQDRAANDFVSKVSQKLLGCPKYAQHVIVELV